MQACAAMSWLENSVYALKVEADVRRQHVQRMQCRATACRSKQPLRVVGQWFGTRVRESKRDDLQFRPRSQG